VAANEDDHDLLICDAGPLIHLDELACLYLLADFSRVLVPEAVWAEVRRHRPKALKNKKVRFERTRAPKTPFPQLEALSQKLTLHRGEVEVLRLALEAPTSCLLVTDDTAARLAANSLGLKVHGTVGILVRAIRREQLSSQEVVAHLQALPAKSTLHVRSSLLESIVDSLRAAPGAPK
jgi:predicted nucleic acid-binding protein